MFVCLSNSIYLSVCLQSVHLYYLSVSLSKYVFMSVSLRVFVCLINYTQLKHFCTLFHYLSGTALFLLRYGCTVVFFFKDLGLPYRVAMVLEILGKSWNWGKKFPGPGRSLNLDCGSWKSWNRQKISFFISKNNKNMLLVKIFLIRQCCKTKTATL